MRKLALPLGLFILGLLTACGLLPQATPQVTESPTPSALSPAATSLVLTPVGTIITVVEASPTPMSLRLWTTEEISPRSEVRGGAVLVEQLEAFQSLHPELMFDVQLKTIVGQGSILNYLRTGRSVAASILPDVVLLPANQLEMAAQEGLIYPLDSLIAPEMVSDLYPAAANLSRVNNVLMGYPFTLVGVEHIAYDSTAITTTFPITWTAMINQENSTFVFPAGDDSGSRFMLQLYLALGGELTNVAGQPNLQLEPLVQALMFLQQGRQTGVLLSESDNLTTSADTWQMFQTGMVNVIPIGVRHFLDNRAFVPDSQYTMVPGPDEPLMPLVEAWVWAVTTPDPTRQALAVELISWLSRDATMGNWTMVAAQLPARRSAFAFWTVEPGYVRFLQTQLELAAPLPAAATQTVITALNNAAYAVIEGSRTVESAAAEAVEAVIHN
ncbi:MAG: extracellular solute-binding protein [Chloroflexi bacterium]|nr:extracellular solute-binding protein [Chloroflexota bacterium]MBP8057209.1 extracellular solute-binding protein [Chloroflexota bacterium]